MSGDVLQMRTEVLLRNTAEVESVLQALERSRQAIKDARENMDTAGPTRQVSRISRWKRSMR